MSYAFDQIPMATQMATEAWVGLFFGGFFRASDGEPPKPIQYSFLTGLGAKGVVQAVPTTPSASLCADPIQQCIVPLLSPAAQPWYSTRTRSSCTTTRRLPRG